MFQIDKSKVTTESETGSVSSERKKLNLSVEVVSTEFFAEENIIKVKGKSIADQNSDNVNSLIKNNQFHTLDIQINKKFTLEKPEWDLISLKVIEDACDFAKTADLGAVCLEEGLAHICLVKEHMTIVCQRLQFQMPKKNRINTNFEKSTLKFLDAVYQSILKYFDFEIIKTVIIASPGFYKNQLYDYIIKQQHKKLIKNHQKIILLHASSGHKHALLEILKDPQVLEQLSSTKFAKETKALQKFFLMMENDPDRAYYGREHVSNAAEQGAIQVLLISDKLFRSSEVFVRKQYIKMVEEVKMVGGTVHIYSSMHETGQSTFILT